jgi:hypothetical protein
MSARSLVQDSVAPASQHGGARSGVNCSLRSLRSLARFAGSLVGGRSAATTTGTATSESVNIDEIDAYVLIAGQRADHGTQSSRGAA